MTLTINDALSHLKTRKDCKKAYEELMKLKTHDELRQESKKECKLHQALCRIAACVTDGVKSKQIARKALAEYDKSRT